MKRGQLSRLLPCSLLVLMAGCSDGVGDLRQWTVAQRSQAMPSVKPVSEPKLYIPLPYTEGVAADPFSVERLTRVLGGGSASNGHKLIEIERNRRREPLEAFPLDVMVMVGSLDRSGKRVALVKVDGLLHQVRVGNYLGQNYGLVTQVAEHEITLREIVQDAGSEWIERMTTLQLQESKK
jgi:type IV pilus assembly protein PilP